MASFSVAQFESIINWHFEVQDNLLDQLHKAHALVQIALSSDFFNNSGSPIPDYMLALSDIIHHAIELNQKSLDTLRNKKQVSDYKR